MCGSNRRNSWANVCLSEVSVSVFCQNGETDLSLARRFLCNAAKTNLCELLSFLYIFTTELPALTISEL